MNGEWDVMVIVRTIVATICLFALAVLWVVGDTKAQTARSTPPMLPIPQASPSPELLEKYSAPPIGLSNIPPTPAEAAGMVPRLTVTRPGGSAHIMPTPAVVAARRAAAVKQGARAATPVLLYHGGPVMNSFSNPFIQIYEIFWLPSALQNHGTTGYSPNYGILQILLGAYLPGHGLLNLATQYYQTSGTTSAYVQNFGYLAGIYADTSPYPASSCTNSATPGNCITDTQIQAEISKVMSINGWTGGINKIFLLYTSSGEGSCFDASSTSCAYLQYCAYHSSFMSGSTPIVYTNQPYADPTYCQSTGQTLPNGDVGDLAANVASHEIIEAVTDPLLNAWYDSAGNEIGDLCAWTFGTNAWSGPKALGNQMWNGSIFELQQEYDNNAGACASVGPQ